MFPRLSACVRVSVCVLFLCELRYQPDVSSLLPLSVGPARRRLQLVDTFTLEIGELKKEMVQTEVSLDGDSDPEVALRG